MPSVARPRALVTPRRPGRSPDDAGERARCARVAHGDLECYLADVTREMGITRQSAQRAADQLNVTLDSLRRLSQVLDQLAAPARPTSVPHVAEKTRVQRV